MRRLEHGLSLLLLGGAILVLLLLRLLPSATEAPRGSVFSSEPHGRRAALLVLDELGFDARSWTRSPGHLPRTQALLVLPAVPETPPAYEAAPAVDADPAAASRSARRLRDPLHYLRFVEEGGTLLAVASEEMLAFLSETLGLDEVAQLELLPEEGGEEPDEEGDGQGDGEPVPACRISLRSGERLDLRWRPRAHFGALPTFSPFEVIAADEQRRNLCVRASVGRGAVALLAPDDDLFLNRALGEGENGLFLVRLVEQLGGGGEVLFDEYALGGWTPDSPIDLALAAGSLGFTLHLALWACLALWLLAWTRAFPRDPEPLAQVSAIQRAGGFAGMLADAGRWDVLARMLRVGVLRRLAGRVGLRRAFSADVPHEQELSAARVDACVSRLLPGAADGSGREEVAALFTDGGVTDAAGLDHLAVRLAELEARVLAPAGRAGRTSAPGSPRGGGANG